MTIWRLWRRSPDLAFFVAKFVMPLSLSLIVPGCNRPPKEIESSTRRFDSRGIVRGIAPDHSAIDIEHEDIRGFMPSMTMALAARNRSETDDLGVGDTVSFRLNVTDNDVWIDNVKRIAAGDVHLPVRTPVQTSASAGPARLREGDGMPSFILTNQDGESVTLERLLGRPLILTFIFTRCPIPNFCPRMSNNFSELQEAVKTSQGALARTRLLSITLDPAFDTPSILREYAAHLGVDPGIWTFATGDPKQIDALTGAFSVYRQTEGGSISHGLATVLVGGDGRIDKIWRGNGWTPAEIIRRIEEHGK